MPARKIMIVRHGEKEKDFPGDPNVDRDGKPDEASLNTQGWARAQALVGFFDDADAPGIAKPDMIFAAAPAADSKRPMETVTPLAEALWPDAADRARHFNTAHDVDDLAGVMNDAVAADGVVLIAWEHHRIPTLAARLNPVPAAPGRWPGYRFDVVWIFDRHGDAWAFSQTPENVLPTDLNKPIKPGDPAA